MLQRKNTKQLLEFITYLFLYKLFFYNKYYWSCFSFSVLVLVCVCDISSIITDTLFTGTAVKSAPDRIIQQINCLCV